MVANQHELQVYKIVEGPTDELHPFTKGCSDTSRELTTDSISMLIGIGQVPMLASISFNAPSGWGSDKVTNQYFEESNAAPSAALVQL